MAHIVPDYLSEYMPGKESIKFFNWNNLMFEPDDNITPKAHYQLVDELFTGHHLFAGECHRGFAKTSILSHKAPLYVAQFGMPNFGRVNNAVLISDTFDQAWQQLLSCESYLERSEKLQAYLKLVKKKEGMLLFQNNKGEEFHISARGAGQSFRGTNYKGQRPQWVIGDDLLSDDILYSKELNEKTIRWWSGTVMKAIDINKYKVTVIGTPLLENDLLGLIMKSPKWHTIKFPVCREFPVKKHLIVPAWPDRFTQDRIMEMYEEAKDLGTENEFFREMMLQVVTEDTRIFKSDMFMDYEYKTIRHQKMKYNFFTSMDLAATIKEKSDYTVIITIAVNADGHWFIVRIDRGRYTPTEAIDLLFQHVRQFRPLEFRAEKAGIQQVLGHFIEQKMLKENTHFLMEHLQNNSIQKKELRILSLHPKFKNRMIHFPTDICQDEVAAMKHEFLGFTKEGSTTGHDDIMDCLANFNDPNFIVLPTDYKEEYIEGFVMEVKDSTVF